METENISASLGEASGEVEGRRISAGNREAPKRKRFVSLCTLSEVCEKKKKKIRHN